MHRENERRVKVIYSLIGLGAVIIPIFLIAVNFQPLGFLINKQKTSSPTSSPTPTVENSQVGIPLLTKDEFSAVRTNTSYLVVDTRGGNAKGNGTLGLSLTELKKAVSLNSHDDLVALFKTQNIILVSSDLIESRQIAQTLKEKDFMVGIYFTNEKI